jgi:hypothetical protein
MKPHPTARKYKQELNVLTDVHSRRLQEYEALLAEMAGNDEDEIDEAFEARFEAEQEAAFARADVAYDRFYRRLVKEDEVTRSAIVYTTWCNLIHLLVCDEHTLDDLITDLRKEYVIGLKNIGEINATTPYDCH